MTPSYLSCRVFIPRPPSALIYMQMWPKVIFLMCLGGIYQSIKASPLANKIEEQPNEAFESIHIDKLERSSRGFINYQLLDPGTYVNFYGTRCAQMEYLEAQSLS